MQLAKFAIPGMHTFRNNNWSMARTRCFSALQQILRLSFKRAIRVRAYTWHFRSDRGCHLNPASITIYIISSLVSPIVCNINKQPVGLSQSPCNPILRTLYKNKNSPFSGSKTYSFTKHCILFPKWNWTKKYIPPRCVEATLSHWNPQSWYGIRGFNPSLNHRRKGPSNVFFSMWIVWLRYCNWLRWINQ